MFCVICVDFQHTSNIQNTSDMPYDNADSSILAANWTNKLTWSTSNPDGSLFFALHKCKSLKSMPNILHEPQIIVVGVKHHDFMDGSWYQKPKGIMSCMCIYVPRVWCKSNEITADIAFSIMFLKFVLELRKVVYHFVSAMNRK